MDIDTNQRKIHQSTCVFNQGKYVFSLPAQHHLCLDVDDPVMSSSLCNTGVVTLGTLMSVMSLTGTTRTPPWTSSRSTVPISWFGLLGHDECRSRTNRGWSSSNARSLCGCGDCCCCWLSGRRRDVGFTIRVGRLVWWIEWVALGVGFVGWVWHGVCCGSVPVFWICIIIILLTFPSHYILFLLFVGFLVGFCVINFTLFPSLLLLHTYSTLVRYSFFPIMIRMNYIEIIVIFIIRSSSWLSLLSIIIVIIIIIIIIVIIHCTVIISTASSYYATTFVSFPTFLLPL